MPSASPEVREALQWGYRDALREYGTLLESFGISIREAAFRGDDLTAKTHVMQARAVIVEAIDVVKKLSAVNTLEPKAIDAKPPPSVSHADRGDRR